MGNRCPECFLVGLKKFEGMPIFLDFFEGSQILNPLFCKIKFFMPRFLEKASLEKLVLVRKKLIYHELYVIVHDGQLV